MVAYFAFIAYALAFIHAALFLIFGRNLYKILFNSFAVVGVGLNIAELAIRAMTTSHLPTSSLYDFLIMLSLSFAVTYFIIYIKYKRTIIGLFIITFSMICSGVAIFAPIHESSDFVYSFWRLIHLPFIILGTTLFIASFLSALMYLFQERQLKNKSFGIVFKRFPPLDTLNKINDTTLRLGFYFLTIGIFFGFVWLFTMEADFATIIKIIVSMFTWILFVIILYLKFYKKITPRQTALWTIFGFLSVLLTYICVAIFLVR